MIKRVFWWTAAAIPLALFAALLVAYATSTNPCDDRQTPVANPMKAIQYCTYGPPDVLQLRDIEKPAPAANEVLVRVRAAAVNPLDWHFLRGTPYIMRIQAGMHYPKETRLGVDFAGTVEAVGKNVTRFHPGDDVFGAKTGAFAQYVTVSQDRGIVPKPASLTFEQASALPVAAVTALQAVRDHGKLQPGEKVLINGASGGVGTFAVQIAKSFGAEVTGVCSTRNVDMVRSLGADHVIDYTREDFAQGSQRYDLLIDNVANRSLSDCRRVLTPHGRYIQVGGGGPNDGRWVGPFPRLLYGLVLSKLTSRQMGFFFAELSHTDFATLSDLIQTGKLRPVIDRRYTLSELPEAMRYLEAGHARGKVVITVESEHESH